MAIIKVDYGTIGGGTPKITLWKSFGVNVATSFDIEFKPKGFILIVNKPSDSTQSIAYYTNINPTSGVADTSGKWWKMWNDQKTWTEHTSSTYSLTDTSFTTSSGLSGYATKQGLIYFK